MQASQKTKDLTKAALLVALIIVLALTPLGYLPVGPIRATTIHIPVIIGAILLGPRWGAFLGGVFGLTSFLTNTLSPTPFSFVFSPLAPAADGMGSPLALIVAFVPRILIGVVAGLVFRLFRNRERLRIPGLLLSGFLGSMTNTILVMFGIYAFFGRAYAAAKNMPYEAFLGFVAGMIGVNGVIEAIVAAVLAAAVCVPLLRILKGRK